MVTSDGKPEPVGDSLQDHADALAAAKRLASILESHRAGLPASTDVSCLPHGALNLAASAAMYAGLPIAADELRLDVVVAKVLPVHGG